MVTIMRQLLYLSGSHAKVPLYFGIHKKKLMKIKGLNPVAKI
jgi:hypothetical protein